jgi:gliding motility-associated-like protein
MINKIYTSLIVIFLSYGAFSQNYNMANSNVTACSGTFYDNGGNIGAYGNNLNLTFTICPSTPGSKVTVNFTTFNLENNFDFLTVYDGPTTASPSLGSYTGTAGPGLASASPTNASGCLTFVFTSDGSVANAGWAGTIACTTPCTTPTANIVSTTPAAVGGVIRICQGGTVSFNGTITGGNGGADIYAWNLGNGTNSALANPTATYPTAGSYQVNLNGTEGGCPNTNSAAVTVQVSTTPTFTSTATPPTICLGQSSNLAATVTMNPFTPNCTPPISGTTFLPDGSGVSYTTAINVNCFNQGQTVTSAANFSNLCLTLEHSYLGDLQITLICPNGNSMILKSYAAGGAGTYLGSPLDDPTVGPGTGYVYCFTPTATTQLVAGPTVIAGVPAGPSIAAGNYAPEQPFTNMIGCPLNGAWTIQVTDNLAADNGYIFNWDVNFTVPAATGGFTPTIATQGWNPTAGLTGTGATTATVTPTATGNQCYTYSMTDNFGCTYTQNQCITVNPNTPVNAGPDLSACPGQTVTIGGTPTGAAGTTYSWAETLNNTQIAISGSTTIANPSVTLSPTATGSVQYTVTGTSGGCTTTDVMTINVTAPPTVTVNSPSICAGNATVTATPSPAGTYNYAWTVPAGATNPGNVATLSTPVSGTYSVIITNPSSGCSSTSSSGTVTVSPAPTVTVNSPNVCASSATVTATPSPAGTYSYAWTVPAGATNPGNVASFSATVSGTYGVIITNTATGCSSLSASGTVTINPNPTVTVNSPSICSGNATVTATPSPAGTYNYAWTVPAGLTNPGNVATFSTSVSGTYSVIITNPTSGCSSTSSSGTVTVSPSPTVSVNSPNVCASSATVTATPTPAGTYSYTWTVPTGATNPGNVASFSATVSGNYSVIITNTTTGCSSIAASGTVTINPNPTVTVNSPSICSGSATVIATPSLAGTYNYAWTVPAAASNPGNVATFSTSTSGNYSVIITNPTTGCSSISATGTVNVSPLPTVTVNNPTNCGTTATVTATPTPAGTYSYAWTVPTGATNPGNVASFSATVSGTYSVIITNPTTGCSSTSASGLATINPNPTVTVNSPSSCGGSVTVTATPTPAGTYNYAWTVPLGVTNPGNVASFSTSTSGSYAVIITNPTTGCSSTSGSGTVTISPVPTVTVNSPTNCGTTATVTATPTPAGTYSYAWTVPTGATNPGNVASFSATVSGTYSVIITNTTTGCLSTSASGTATINPVPTVSVNSPTSCGGSVTVTATPTPAGTYNYAWTVPLGVTNPGNVASFSTSTSGSYAVIITNPSTGCSSTSASGSVTINVVPTVTVNSPTICGTTATVTASPAPAGTYTYAWTVPTGATNPGNVASFSATVSGTYSVIITNTTTGCLSTSASGTVTINPVPTVTVNSPSACQNGQVTLTATPVPAGTYNYSWTVPTGVTNPGNVASFNSSTAGTYAVIITDPTTNCSSSSASGIVTINPNPSVSVNSPSICSGSNATVIATPTPSGTYAYAWTVPAGATNPGNVATFTTAVAGAYSVIITNPSTGCFSSSASGTVSSNSNPTVTVNDDIICQNNIATIAATPSPAGTYSYAWTVPSGAVNPGNLATFNTSTAGTYTVIITNTATGCSSVSVSGIVTVNSIPTVTVNSPSACDGFSATVTAIPSPAGTYDYAWTVPVVTTNPGNVASFSTAQAGSYSVIITNPITGCSSNSNGGVVTINLNPTVLVNNPITCTDIPTLMAATPSPAGTYTYSWTVPAGVSNPGSTATFNSAVAGTYSVVITNPITGCVSASSSGVLTVNANPQPIFISDVTEGCVPLTVNFINQTPNADDCVWSINNGVQLTGCDTVTYTFIQSGCYDVTLTTTSNNGCIGSSTITNMICVEDLPNASFVAQNNPVSTLEPIIPFINTSTGATSYVWDFGDSSSLSYEIDPTHTYGSFEATYLVTLIAISDAGCVDTTTVPVQVQEELIYYIPNSFSPDADPYNNVFEPIFSSGFNPKGYTLLIFDRWGEILFESHNTEVGWDGTYNGSIVQDGTYIWKIEFKLSNNDGKVMDTGHVNLIR